MKKFVTLFLVFSLSLVASINASAFFRLHDFRSRMAPEPISAEAPPAVLKADPCSLMIRYTPATVASDIMEIHYNGSAECRAWWRTALAAGAPTAGMDAPKVSQGPAEAPPSVYECAINVNFSPATAGSPSLVYTGAASCTSTRSMAIAGALRAVTQMCSVDPACF